MSKLVICEKPSVAKSIASALGVTSRAGGYFEGNGYLISWCIGHLVGLADAAVYDERYRKWRYADLPILPNPFRYLVSGEKAARFRVLQSLMARPDVTELVNACDAGREGELIFRLVYETAGCAKPFSRLWISSMEDAAIREGVANLRPSAVYDPLYRSALCRQKADWLIGINASRLFSVLYHRTLNVGRVQTPTLAMLVDRDNKILLFHLEKYHLVRLALAGIEAVSEKIPAREDAETFREACDGQTATCRSVTREQKTEQPPKLYDLTTLQREANRVFGYTAKQTLDCAQSLYEKKLLTYPRTDSRYLPSGMAETAAALLHLAAQVPPFTTCPNFFPKIAALVDDNKVTDHHAILPTLELEKTELSALPVAERNLLLLICCNLLCAAAEPSVYETVTAAFDCGGHTFTAKGKQQRTTGWRGIQKIFRSSLKGQPEEQDAEITLPALTEGEIFGPVAAAVTEQFTKPPKPYTEDTLLAAMERAGRENLPEDAERRGLGTPATRASIIEKLVSTGLAERKGRSLTPTKDGINLITVLPELLISPKLTADWEQRLEEIAKGQASPKEFMQGIEQLVTELVQHYAQISEDSQRLFRPERKQVGACPRCGKPVYENKRNFACSDRSCQFVMWKNDRFFERRETPFTADIATALLRDGRAKVKGLRSLRTGKRYDGTIALADTGGKYVNYRIEIKEK